MDSRRPTNNSDSISSSIEVTDVHSLHSNSSSNSSMVVHLHLADTVDIHLHLRLVDTMGTTRTQTRTTIIQIRRMTRTRVVISKDSTAKVAVNHKTAADNTMDLHSKCRSIQRHRTIT